MSKVGSIEAELNIGEYERDEPIEHCGPTIPDLIEKEVKSHLDACLKTGENFESDQEEVRFLKRNWEGIRRFLSPLQEAWVLNSYVLEDDKIAEKIPQDTEFHLGNVLIFSFDFSKYTPLTEALTARGKDGVDLLARFNSAFMSVMEDFYGRHKLFLNLTEGDLQRVFGIDKNLAEIAAMKDDFYALLETFKESSLVHKIEEIASRHFGEAYHFDVKAGIHVADEAWLKYMGDEKVRGRLVLLGPNIDKIDEVMKIPGIVSTTEEAKRYLQASEAELKKETFDNMAFQELARSRPELPDNPILWRKIIQKGLSFCENGTYHHMQEYLDEEAFFKQATVFRLEIEGLSYETEEDRNLVNRLYTEIEYIMKKWQVSSEQLTFECGKMKVYGISGGFRILEGKDDRALQCALEIRNHFEKNYKLHGISVVTGMATSIKHADTASRSVGGKTLVRITFGDIFPRSARIGMTARDKLKKKGILGANVGANVIWVDKELFRSNSGAYDFGPENLERMKGIEDKVSIYELLAKKPQADYEDINIPYRSAELQEWQTVLTKQNRLLVVGNEHNLVAEFGRLFLDPERELIISLEATRYNAVPGRDAKEIVRQLLACSNDDEVTRRLKLMEREGGEESDVFQKEYVAALIWLFEPFRNSGRLREAAANYSNLLPQAISYLAREVMKRENKSIFLAIQKGHHLIDKDVIAILLEENSNLGCLMSMEAGNGQIWNTIFGKKYQLNALSHDQSRELTNSLLRQFLDENCEIDMIHPNLFGVVFAKTRGDPARLKAFVKAMTETEKSGERKFLQKYEFGNWRLKQDLAAFIREFNFSDEKLLDVVTRNFESTEARMIMECCAFLGEEFQAADVWEILAEVYGEGVLKERFDQISENGHRQAIDLPAIGKLNEILNLLVERGLLIQMRQEEGNSIYALENLDTEKQLIGELPLMKQAVGFWRRAQMLRADDVLGSFKRYMEAVKVFEGDLQKLPRELVQELAVTAYQAAIFAEQNFNPEVAVECLEQIEKIYRAIQLLPEGVNYAQLKKKQGDLYWLQGRATLSLKSFEEYAENAGNLSLREQLDLAVAIAQQKKKINDEEALIYLARLSEEMVKNLDDNKDRYLTEGGLSEVECLRWKYFFRQAYLVAMVGKLRKLENEEKMKFGEGIAKSYEELIGAINEDLQNFQNPPQELTTEHLRILANFGAFLIYFRKYCLDIPQFKKEEPKIVEQLWVVLEEALMCSKRTIVSGIKDQLQWEIIAYIYIYLVQASTAKKDLHSAYQFGREGREFQRSVSWSSYAKCLLNVADAVHNASKVGNASFDDLKKGYEVSKEALIAIQLIEPRASEKIQENKSLFMLAIAHLLYFRDKMLIQGSIDENGQQFREYSSEIISFFNIWKICHEEQKPLMTIELMEFFHYMENRVDTFYSTKR